MTLTGRHTVRIAVLGGSPYHPGGLEAFCERASRALRIHRPDWQVTALPTNAAYLRPGRIRGLLAGLRGLDRTHRAGLDVVWLQFSSLLDLAYLRRARALGLPVIVTPHLGANSRLQRVAVLRRLCTRLLGAADRITLLYDGQEREIALPRNVPRSILRTFLPEASLQPSPSSTMTAGPLRLVHAGRLSEGKGSVAMVALCGALRRAGVPFTARLIGRADPATTDLIRAAITGQEVGDALTWSAWMPEPELLAALRDADVLVHLSQLDSYPLIVLEALTAETVPLVREMPGARAIVEHYGGHIAGDEDPVGAAAHWLAAQDLADLRRLGAASAARVRQDFAWSACVAAVGDAVESTLRVRDDSAFARSP